MENKKKYLVFTDVSAYSEHSHKKTKTFRITNRTGEELGSILWSGAWRRYVFLTPKVYLQFDAGCLQDIIDFITELMNERKTKTT